MKIVFIFGISIIIVLFIGFVVWQMTLPKSEKEELAAPPATIRGEIAPPSEEIEDNN